MQPSENPFTMPGGSFRPQPPVHFRRHGTAEHGFTPQGFERVDVTPTRSPNPSPATSPRGSRRNRNRDDDDDEPPSRRDRSREARSERDNSPQAPASSMPAEWGARTLRVEKMIQECTAEIRKVNESITDIKAKMTNDHNRLNAIEGALPERVHRCEERQANHIEILNGFARTASEQISTLQYRMNSLEGSVPAPGAAHPSAQPGGTYPSAPMFGASPG